MIEAAPYIIFVLMVALIFILIGEDEGGEK